MSTASRVPSVVSMTGNIQTVATAEFTPLRTQRFVGEQLKSPTDIARQLNQMQDQLKEATLPARSNPHNQHILFANQDVVVGIPFSLTHKLNRLVRWSVVRWRGATVGASVWEGDGAQENPNTLVLNTSITGTADIEVW